MVSVARMAPRFQDVTVREDASYPGHFIWLQARDLMDHQWKEWGPIALDERYALIPAERILVNRDEARRAIREAAIAELVERALQTPTRTLDPWRP